jgi:NADH dehydrogenase
MMLLQFVITVKKNRTRIFGLFSIAPARDLNRAVPCLRYSGVIRHRVLILGGGFGGLYAARELARAPVDVTHIDRRNFHLFQPLLYQVSTGALSPADISAPIRQVLNRNGNTRVLLGEAVDLDPGARTLTLADGGVFEYDSLIVATGSKTTYYGNDKWREWAPSLKSVEEATAIRHKILYAFEAAERTSDPELRRAWLTFLIVGGGATGVELAGALAEIARYTLRNDFRSIKPEEAQIQILDGGSRVLSPYPEELSRKAERSLLKLGVRVRNDVRVVGIDAGGLTYHNEQGDTRPVYIPAKTVLWAGGVTATEFGRTLATRTAAETTRNGSIKVRPDLTIPNHPEIYIVGDLAAATNPDGKPLPGVAQVAMQGGAYAARAIVSRLEGPVELPPFRYFDKGDLAVIGRGAAVARIFGFNLSGLVAWLVWVFIHLLYLVQFQSRLVVMIRWGFQYLSFDRGALLITGTAAPIAAVQSETMENLTED